MTVAKKKNKDGKSRRRRTIADEADWSSVDAGLLRRVIDAVAQTGGAARFGYSRDGGAYAVGIYGDGKPFTEFCPAPADVESWLEGFVLDYE